MKKPRLKYYNLWQTAHDCIEFVGKANYSEREALAKKILFDSYKTGKFINVWDVEEEVKP